MPSQSKPATEDRRIGYVFSFLAGICFAIMAFLVNHYSSLYTSNQMAFFRAITNFIFLIPFIYKDISKIYKKDSHILWIRFFSGAISLLCYFWNLQQSSVGIAIGIFYTVPAFVALLGWFILNEKLSLIEILGISLTVGGAILAKSFASIEVSNIVVLVGLLGAALGSVAFLSLRKATTSNYSPALIVWGLSGVTAIISFVLSHKLSFKISNFELLVVLVCISFLGLAAQLFQTYAFLYLRAAVASSMGTLTLIFGVTLQTILSNTAPTLLELISYIVIILGVIVLHFGRQHTKS